MKDEWKDIRSEHVIINPNYLGSVFSYETTSINQLAMKAKHERKIKGIKEGYARAMGKQREGLLLE